MQSDTQKKWHEKSLKEISAKLTKSKSKKLSPKNINPTNTHNNMKTFEINVKVAGGSRTCTIKANNIMEALVAASKTVANGLTDLAKSFLEEVSVKEL